MSKYVEDVRDSEADGVEADDAYVGATAGGSAAAGVSAAANAVAGVAGHSAAGLGIADSAAAERIIVALDCGADQALRLADQLAGSARWLKVGMTLYYAAGPAIISEFKQRGFKVFVDLKLHDIPHQVDGAAAAVVEAGADMLTVHGAGGMAMMRAAADAVQRAVTGRAKPIVLAITVLTSMDETSLEQVGVAKPLAEQVKSLAALAQQAGLDGVVASPNEAAALRSLLGPAAAIVTPGVRPAGASTDDQSRVATPAAAIAAGASHLVIGRPITAAADPLAAFNQIAAEVEAAPLHPVSLRA